MLQFPICFYCVVVFVCAQVGVYVHAPLFHLPFRKSYFVFNFRGEMEQKEVCFGLGYRVCDLKTGDDGYYREQMIECE